MSDNRPLSMGNQTIITINKDKCTDCGVCREVCAVLRNMGFPSLEAPECRHMCIRCGHCMAICPQSAISIADLAPATPVGELPSEQQALDLVRARRSIRVFKQQQIRKQDWEKLIEAVKYTPTGHNTQGIALMIIESADILEEISAIGMSLLKNLSRRINMPVLRHLYKRMMGERTYATASKLLTFTSCQEEMIERGDDPILFHAPALMLFLTQKSEQLGQVHGDLAAHTAAIYAPTLGIGTCYAGIVMLAFSGPGSQSKIRKVVNLPEEYTVSNALMVGYAKHQYRNIPDRKALNILYQ